MVAITRKYQLQPSCFFDFEALNQCYEADVLYFNRQELAAYLALRKRVNETKTFTADDGLLVTRLFENMRSMDESTHNLESMVLKALTAYTKKVDQKVMEICFDKSVNLYTAIRLYAGKTLEQVAEFLGVETEDIAKWETETDVPDEYFVRLSEFYFFPQAYFEPSRQLDPKITVGNSMADIIDAYESSATPEKDFVNEVTSVHLRNRVISDNDKDEE